MNKRLMVVVLVVVLVVSALSTTGMVYPLARPAAALAAAPREQSPAPKELVMWINTQHGMDQGLDPTVAWGYTGVTLLFSSLLARDEHMNTGKDLVTDYQVSDDGLVWHLNIRQDALFTDNTPVTAKDVVYTYNRIKTGAGGFFDLNMMEEAKALGDYEVEFRLSSPPQVAAFQYALSVIGIAPQHAHEGHEQEFSRNPIGSGPYQLVRWDENQQLVLEANPLYYGEKPYFHRIVSLLTSEDTALAAAKAGELQLIKVEPIYASQEIEGMRLQSRSTPSIYGVSFPFVPDTGEKDAEGHPIGNNITSDLAIRRAISYAVDREALVAGVMNGSGLAVYGPVAPLAWNNPANEFKDADPDKAKQILSEGGWADTDGDGVVEKDGLKAEFDLLYAASETTRQGLSLAVADMVAPIGIKVTPKGVSWDEMKPLMYSTPVMFMTGGSTPFEFYRAYHTAWQGVGWYNPIYYSNPAVDSYLDKAMSALDEQDAIKYWQQAQWDGQTGINILGDTAWAWLVSDTNNYLVNECLDIGNLEVEEGSAHGFPRDILNWRWTCD